jgi:hypothetical protein
MNANLAFAPIRTGSLYDRLGVDFLSDADLAIGDESRGEAIFVEWVEGADQRDEDSGGDPLAQADQILADAGYRRISDWDLSLADYAQARIELRGRSND